MYTAYLNVQRVLILYAKYVSNNPIAVLYQKIKIYKSRENELT